MVMNVTRDATRREAEAEQAAQSAEAMVGVVVIRDMCIVEVR